MSVAFKRSQTLTRGDLDIFLTNASGNVANASSITYAIFFVDNMVDVLIGDPARIPENPAVGEYYASLRIPATASYGTYRIKWTIKELVNSPEQTVIQEFGVVSETTIVGNSFSTNERIMVDKLRLLLRDQCIGGEEKILLDVNGEKVIITLEELYDLIDKENDSIIKESFKEGTLKIQSMDKEGNLSWQKIEKAHKNETSWESIYSIETELGSMILTGGHRVYTDIDYAVEVEDLKEGDSVYSLQGKVKILAISQIDNREHMYDLTVENNHNLFLFDSKILVHNCPDKFYHFRPPEAEANVGQYNRVFGQVWEDVELLEYIERALDWWNMMPPETDGAYKNIDVLCNQKPAWRTAIFQGAIQFAAMALQANWIVDEFDYSIGGISLNIDKSSKYEGLRSAAESQWQTATEMKARTTKIIRGLQQPKYGVGIRSAFGPHVGRGVLSPRNFL
jgi:hypothetical protein